MKIGKLLEQIVDSFETFKRDGSDKEIVKLKDGHPEWMTDVIRAGHGDTGPDDMMYEQIRGILYHFSDQDNKDEDSLRESIYEIEPDVYTSDLTAWLNNDNSNVYYMSQAQEEFGAVTDGFELLSAAQSIYLHEMAERVLSALEEVADDDAITPDEPDPRPNPKFHIGDFVKTMYLRQDVIFQINEMAFRYDDEADEWEWACASLKEPDYLISEILLDSSSEAEFQSYKARYENS